MEVESPKDAVAVTSDLEEKEGKAEGNFLERMRRRDQKEVRRGILLGGEPSPRLKKYPAASTSRRRARPVAPATPNPIEELDCSQDMKDFMMAEHAREKELYKDVAENQIANSVIHRFRTHLANSEKPKDVLSRKSKVGNMKAKVSSRKKPKSSVEIGSGEESEEDDISIQEFDEAELPPPAEGSFSLSPSPSQLRRSRNLLVRFTTDHEAFPITNGPSQVLSKYSLGNEELSAGEEKKGASQAGRKSKQKSPRRVKRPVVEVEPRKEGAKRRKLEEFPSTAVVGNSDFKAVTTSQGDVKTKKTVTINSQPEYFSSSEPVDEIYREGEEEARVVPLKSILKKSPIPNEVLPSSPEVLPSPQSEEVAVPVSQEKPRTVKRNLLSIFCEATPLSDEKFANLVKDMEKIHNSPNVSLEEEDKAKNVEFEKFLENLLNIKVCGGCGGGGGETRELQVCGGCQTVAYCDKNCQKAGWARHKLVCGQLDRLRNQETRDGKLRGREKKDLIQSGLPPGAANSRPKTDPVKTPSPSTPETSPTLAEAVRTDSSKRIHRKKFLPVLERTATPNNSQELQEHFVNDEERLLILPPRKINFAAFAVNDEVVADPGEILSLGSSSSHSLELAGDSSSSQTGRKEEFDPPSSLELLSDFGSQKVGMRSSILLWIILVVFQTSEDIAGLFSDPESSPEIESRGNDSQKILNYYKIYD